MKARWLDAMRGNARQAKTIARKELGAYFGSPMALIFVGAFLVAALFSFFWVETFFARNMADVRPLFRWMPVLMIFLVGALTMRQWSEEQRGGTLEVLFTLPVRRFNLVIGKFLAVMALVAVALGLTLFLPITVEILGDLDWGPVVGGYLAALLMASAYAAIGLFVSSRTDNQIVALILTVLVCAVFYLVGSSGVIDFVGEAPAQIMRALGTGSRFESIERGVIDLRDLVYYLSLTAIFLVLNVISLDSKRWSSGDHMIAYRRGAWLNVVLVGANLLALNVWIFPVNGMRLDLTADKEYSLSRVTVDLLRTLQEPLLMRGYLSEKTHPLLAPLVPALRDMMREYEVASRGKIKVEIVDPRDDEALEEEANQLYGIRPTPFRVLGRYEDTVINSYFDVLVRYGDQSLVLGFGDLIQVESRGDQVDVKLRNVEYDLTSAIKKVVYGFQSLDMIFAGIEDPVKLTAFITPATLPETLQEVPARLDKVAQEMQEEVGSKFVFEQIDPDDPNATVTRQALFDAYGLQPFAASLFSSDTYYLHLVLEIGDEITVLYPPGEASEADLRGEIEASLKRTVPGFLKTVGLWHPSEDPVTDMYGSTQQPLSTWSMLRAQLSQNYTVKSVDLYSGYVPGDVDVLVVVAPQALTDRERFAIDQYLMRGGAVVVASGSYVLSPQQMGGGILMQEVIEGVADLLSSYGVGIGNAMVMDTQNEPFPIQVPRQVGDMSVVEIQQMPYPFFVDVRQDGMSKDSPIVANLAAVTLQWASPLEIDEGKTADMQVDVLLRSTANAWLRSNVDVSPDLQLYPELGFPVEGEQQAWPLAVSIVGSFDSYFRDRPSPFQESLDAEVPGDNEDGGGSSEAPEASDEVSRATIETSPDSARLVVIGSAEFLDDAVLDISQRQSQNRFLFNLQLLENAVDWAAEDEELLSIRSRGTYARLLNPMDEREQAFWEAANYVVALIGLAALGVVWNMRQRGEEAMQLVEEEQL